MRGLCWRVPPLIGMPRRSFDQTEGDLQSGFRSVCLCRSSAAADTARRHVRCMSTSGWVGYKTMYSWTCPYMY